MNSSSYLSSVAACISLFFICSSVSANLYQLPASARAATPDLNGNGLLEPYEDTTLPDEQRIDDLISRMTLIEKINMLTGTGFSVGASGGSQKVPGAAGESYALKRFGIPSIVFADGPAGLRIKPTREDDRKSYYATAFPIATALASTWDPHLVERVGQAMGNEVKEYGVDVLLAPAMNIQLNPLAGRNFEYYSEDPLVSGTLAASMVNGVQSQGVGATIKHYVANNVETSRMVLDAKIGERAMREIYLKGFELAIKNAHPWAVMSSYNKVNGTYTSQSFDLLHSVLRGEWGYTGMVMSDWFSGDDAAEQAAAGNDLIMPGIQPDRDEISKAIELGRLSGAELDRNLKRVLQLVFRSPSMQNYQYSDHPALLEHAQLARQAAAEAVVLLKNAHQVLPFSKDIQQIAAFGNTSYDFIAGGSGSGDVNEAYTVSLVEGLNQHHLVVDAELADIYQRYAKQQKAKRIKPKTMFELVPLIPEMPIDPALVEQKAKTADIALITLGRNSGEFQDRELSDFNLSPSEQALITQVSKHFHRQNKKVVVVLNVGNVIETASWKDKVDAIVLPWQGGQEAGNAVVDVLSGEVNPSGKLAVTFPLKYQQLPSAKTFPGKATSEQIVMDPYLKFALGMPSEIQYNEGIYVGYRYFDSFAQDVSFPFGYGLSYTNFAYGNAKLNRATFNGEIKAWLTVTNTGERAGKEVVQLYVSAPQGQLEKPQQELKAFAKTVLLEPGQSQTLSFTLTAEQLASFDDFGSQWLLEKGEYLLALSSSSRERKLSLPFFVDHTQPLGHQLLSLKPRHELKLLNQQ
ncbi:beta-glucosidase [Agarivorans sp. QJM3NY_25]|uniref:beta-glucosidase family protein n=1 Tax=Agarivorans sp. QJM3NY_25 TaxID=3421430 RepID=UPI003D7CE1C0